MKDGWMKKGWIKDGWMNEKRIDGWRGMKDGWVWMDE